MTIRQILLYLFIFNILNTSAQADWNKNLVASPNAASLGVYADIPVSLYTGIPSINIPIYTIKLNSFELPISIAYHASGIKVAQEASWVGLGWSLNAGGVITRSIRGFSDMEEWGEGGYPYEEDLPSPSDYDKLSGYFSALNYETYPFVDAIDMSSVTLTKDTEPDIFSFNFAGHMGQFMTKKLGSSLSYDLEGIQLNPKEPLKIRSIGYDWTIQTAEGISYTFNRQERKKVVSGSGHIQEYIHPSNYTISNDYITAWYLSKIELPNEDAIDFIYEEENNAYESPRFTFEESFKILYATPDNPEIHNMKDPSNETNTVDRLYKGQRLKEIRWKEGKILFLTSERQDMIQVTGGDTPQKLDRIEIFPFNSDNLLKYFSFQTSYFGDLQETSSERCRHNLRLKLDAINFGSKSKQEGTYRFEYNKNIQSLPEKNAYSTDYWGYYNGMAGFSQIPPFVNTKDIEFTDNDGSKHLILQKNTIIGGTNRKSNEEYAQMCILKKIIYPTGGEMNLDYELNDYASNEPTPETYRQKKTAELTRQNRNYSVSFTLEKETSVEVQTYYSVSLPLYEDKKILICTAKLYNEQNEEIADLSYLDKCIESAYQESGDQQSGSQGIWKTLPKGTYTLNFELGDYGYPCNIENLVIYQYLTFPTQNKGGGLRVRQISTPFYTKKYSYILPSGETSGKLLSPVTTASFNIKSLTLMESGYYGIPIFRQKYVQNNKSYNCVYLTRVSSSYKPIDSSFSGTPIGYSEIKVTTSDLQKTYTEQYIFYNEPDEVSEILNIPNKSDIRNGNLLEDKKYDAQGKLIQKNSYEYPVSLFNDYAFRALKLNSGDLVFYTTYAHHCPLSVKYTTNYFYHENGQQDSVKVYESYKYNKNLLVYETYKNWDVTDEVNNIRYATDLTGNTYQDMTERFMIGIPIEKTVSRNNQITSGSLTTYAQFNNQYLPSTIYGLTEQTELSNTQKNDLYTGETVSPLYGDPVITFEKYDAKGNILSVLENGSDRTIYVWSYQYRYLVAEIRNASIEQIKALGVNPDSYGKTNTPNMTLLNNLRNALPESEITTYQYTPLLGLVSSTDPRGITIYYEYDTFGRLESIKDSHSNVLKNYKYHYKN